MKLLFALLLFFFVVPLCLLVAALGFKSEESDHADVSLAELISGVWPASGGVRLDVHFVREAAPDDLLANGGYYFPIVDDDGAAAVALADDWSPAARGPFVVAHVSGDRLPVEAFFAPLSGARSHVTPPFVLEGVRGSRTTLPGRIARSLGVPEGSEVVVIRSIPNRIGRIAAAVVGLLGCAFLWLGVRLLRSRSRARRLESEAAARRVGALTAKRAASGTPPPLPGGRKAALASPPVRTARSVPWGKIAAVIVVLGVGAARVGRRAAPAATDVARSVTRASDEAAIAAERLAKRAGPKAELPNAGDLAVEAVTQVSNVNTAYSAARSTSGSQLGSGRPRTLHVTDQIREWIERFERRDGMTFELVETRSVSDVSGGFVGSSDESNTAEDDELPDSMHGEFIRITLSERPDVQGVRLARVAAISVENGYVEVFTASGDMEFVHGGTWDRLVDGEVSVLRFTDRGRSEYAAGILDLYKRVAVRALVNEGASDVEVNVRWSPSPEFQVTTSADGIELHIVRPATVRLAATVRM